jgi:hypothetical protein
MNTGNMLSDSLVAAYAAIVRPEVTDYILWYAGGAVLASIALYNAGLNLFCYRLGTDDRRINLSK